MLQTIAFETVLKARKQELEGRLHRIETDLDQPTSADSEERAIETEDDEVMEGLGQAGLAELKSIDAALERMTKGTFGICVKCGEPISENRLKAVPHAAVCSNCFRTPGH
jgi:RNA polymerase-binding transcription factor DksA